MSRHALALFAAILTLWGCTTMPSYDKTVSKVELGRFMTKWYVIASRPTGFEKDAFNATEAYTFNTAEDRIDIDFRFNQGSADGPIKTIPQTARVFNKDTFAHWKVKPSWWWFPFQADYLIIGLHPDYEWTAVGVPNQKYLWVMAQKPHMSDELLKKILDDLRASGYDTSRVERVPQTRE